jgi:hypothetical protein
MGNNNPGTRRIGGSSGSEAERYVITVDDVMVDATDDLKEAQQISDSKVDGRVFDTYERRFIY